MRKPAVHSTLILLGWCCLVWPSLALSEEDDSANVLDAGLVDARLNVLRDGGAGDDNETVIAYAQVRSWLDQAAAHDSDAEAYNEALTEAPGLEAELQARIDSACQSNWNRRSSASVSGSFGRC